MKIFNIEGIHVNSVEDHYKTVFLLSLLAGPTQTETLDIYLIIITVLSGSGVTIDPTCTLPIQ